MCAAVPKAVLAMAVTLPPGNAGVGGRNGGFTFIGLLIAVALLGLALAGSGVVWHLEARRDKEQQLLFAGEQIRAAIARYRDASPGGNKQFPEHLEDLLQDRRFPMPVRHLRRLYRDPLTADGVWQVVREQGRIIGVVSKAEGRPLKLAGFPPAQKDFEGAGSYAGWRFVLAPEQPATASGGSAGGNGEANRD